MVEVRECTLPLSVAPWVAQFDQSVTLHF
jgi:hypothetical protein